MSTTRLNPTTKAALAAAVEEDHPCSDPGCDIATALLHGFTYAAALLLTGATETPNVNAVAARYDLNLDALHSPAFERWCAFHREHGRQCESCESYTYANPDTGYEPAYCANCRAELPATTEGTDDE